jgi:hypothetical protein
MFRWVVAISAVLTLVGGSADLAAAAAKKSTPTTTAPSRPAFSAASGTVAAVSTGSMEVQNPTSGQVTVSWTPTTTFNQTVTVPATQLAVGDCVTVTSSTKAKSGPIKATTVSLRTSTNGSCTGAGAGFGAGGAPGGTPSGGSAGPGAFAGRGFPRGTFPGGTFPRNGAAANRFRAAAGRFATGQVVSLSGGTFVVKGFTVVPPSTSSKSTKGSKSKTSAPTRKTVETKVTFGGSTKFTMVQQASASNLSVGLCATALGPADQTGAIAATTISLSTAGASGCTTTFGGFGGFGRLGGAGGST